MWLKNNTLKVFFDEHRGGMPTRDNFGFLSAVAIELAYTPGPPFFQSLNDPRPRITREGNNKLTASGIMQKGGRLLPHTYVMTATLDENVLNLRYKLNITKTQGILRSKIWLFTTPDIRGCKISGETMVKDIGGATNWKVLYRGKQLVGEPVIFSKKGRVLKVFGETDPPLYSAVLRFKRYPKYEVVHGWSKVEYDKMFQRTTITKGTYAGHFRLKYM